MTKDILYRIACVLKSNSLSQSALAKQLSVAQTTLNNQLSGRATLSYQTVYGLINIFPDLSAEWLMRGEGDMLRSSGVHQESLGVNSNNIHSAHIDNLTQVSGHSRIDNSFNNSEGFARLRDRMDENLSHITAIEALKGELEAKQEEIAKLLEIISNMAQK